KIRNRPSNARNGKRLVPLAAESDSPAGQAGRGLFLIKLGLAVNLLHLPDEPAGVVIRVGECVFTSSLALRVSVSRCIIRANRPTVPPRGTVRRRDAAGVPPEVFPGQRKVEIEPRCSREWR